MIVEALGAEFELIASLEGVRRLTLKPSLSINSLVLKGNCRSAERDFPAFLSSSSNFHPA